MGGPQVEQLCDNLISNSALLRTWAASMDVIMSMYGGEKAIKGMIAPIADEMLEAVKVIRTLKNDGVK